MRYTIPLLAAFVLLLLASAGPPATVAVDDLDGDGVLDTVDNCPTVPNPDQTDSEGDGIGDACDDDWDNDGVSNTFDWCEGTAPGAPVDSQGCSQAQADPDGDGFCGSVPTWCAAPDVCEGIPNPGQEDAEHDRVGDVCDNCPAFHNDAQTDGDNDGLGDTCDPCSRFGGLCLRVLPAQPSRGDFIQVRLSGSYPNSCWNSSASHSISDFTVYVTLVFQVFQGICDTLVSDWAKTLDLGVLPFGYYEVQFSSQAVGGPCGSECGGGTIAFTLPGGDRDGDGLANESDTDDDNDGFSDEHEVGHPLCENSINEDSFNDGVADDGCPGAAPEAGAFTEGLYHIGTGSLDPCGTDGWPADLVSGGVPDSTNRVTLADLTSFFAPTRHFGSSPPNWAFSSRWDLVPGPGLFGAWINISDLTRVISVAPPMFAGERAFGGPACTP
jgi:hypothetical protein